MDTYTAYELVYKNREKKHKNKPVQFVSVAGGVKNRLEKNLNYRKSCRLTVFDNIRDLSQTETPVKQDNVRDKQERRRQQLEKWKQEKEKKKKEQEVGKKKPFVAGVVSVPLKFVLPPPPKAMPSTSGRVTRSQSKISNKQDKPLVQSFAPENASFRPPQLKNALTLGPVPPKNKHKKPFNFSFNPVIDKAEMTTRAVKTTRSKTNLVTNQISQELTSRMNTRSKLTSNNINKVSKNKITKSPKKTKKLTETHALIQEIEPQSDLTNASPMTHMPRSRRSRQCHSEDSRRLDHNSPKMHNTVVTPQRLTPKTIPRSESSSEEKLRSPKEAAVLCDMTPEQIVEQASRISPCVTLSRGKDNARREMKKKMKEGLLDEYANNMDSVQDFRRQLQSEIARITARCEHWDDIYNNTTLPEFVQEQALSALGQARLLMSQKLQQFSGLVDRCLAHDTGAGLITPADLQGFWDMIFLQIENVDLRFKKLEELRARDWAEDTPKPVKKKSVARAGKRASSKPAATSRLQEMIAAARKAKQEQSQTSSGEGSSSEATTSPLTPGGASKTFEAGFFSVRTPVRSPAPATPRNNRASLLKNVLSSEARKASASKQSASYAMLRASVMGKNVEIEGVTPLELTPKLPSIDLNATPARSILKSAAKPSAKKSAKKSIKTVLFDEFDDENTDATANRPEGNTDSGVSYMDVEKEVENKENRKKNKLVRQDAVSISPTMTRSRRQSMATPQEEPNARTSRRKKALQESNIIEDRSRKLNLEEEVPKVTPRRSLRSKLTEDLIDFGTPEETPRRRRRGAKAANV